MVGVGHDHRIRIGNQNPGDRFVAGEIAAAGIVDGDAQGERQRTEASQQRQQNQPQKPEHRSSASGPTNRRKMASCHRHRCNERAG